MRIDEELISGATFEALLRWLHPNRDQAGEIYERMRAQLIRFFSIQNCPFPEECADDTLQRAAVKISQGVEVRAADPYTYLRGIARNVLHEAWKRQQRAPTALDDLPSAAQPAAMPNDAAASDETRREQMLTCLQRCLQELPEESRQLFISYHQSETGARIDARNELAARLGIDITALRNRVTRIRIKLESCLRNCLEK
jgi:RNA polymerase sigma factor (sigma-70 family)